MTSENDIGKGPDQVAPKEKRTSVPPFIFGLSPMGWETGVCLYRSRADLLDLEFGVVSSTKVAKEMNISPQKPIFGQAIGWKIQADFPEKGGRTIVSYSRIERGLEHKRFCNVWKWDRGGLTWLTAQKGDDIELYAKPIAIIPVPGKPGARLPEDKGGVIIVPIAELEKEFTQRKIKGFFRGDEASRASGANRV